MKTKERREQSQCNMTVHVHSLLSFDFLSVLSSLSAHVDEKEGREEKRERERKELSLNSQTFLPVCILCWCRYSLGKQILFTLETTHSLSLAERCISLSRLLRTYTHIHICIYFVAHRRFISMVVSLTSSSTYSFRHTHGHALSCACFRLPTFNSLWWSRNSRSSYIYLCNE